MADGRNGTVERRAVRRGRFRASGDSLMAICDMLNEKGLHNRAGGIFTPSHVAQLLERHGDGITLRSA